MASTATDTSGDVVKPKIPSELSIRYSQYMVEKHPTSTCDVAPETSTGMKPLNYDWSNSVSIISAVESVASTTTDTSGDVLKSKTPSQLSSGKEALNITVNFILSSRGTV